jgi:hypothetical protein
MTHIDETLFDPRVADWLEDDPRRAPDEALDVILAAFPSIKQRRASRVPWRTPVMSSTMRLGLAGAAVVAVAGGAVFLIGLRPNTGPMASTSAGPSSLTSPAPPGSTSSGAPTLPRAGAVGPGRYAIAWGVGGQSAGRTVMLEFDVPAGWSAVDGSGLIKHNDQPGEVDWALSNPVGVYSDACAPGATLAAIGSSVNDLVTALLDQTGSEATRPADVTLDGYPAKRIDISIPEDLDTTTCRISGLQIWAQVGGGFLAFPDGWSVSVYVVNVDGGRLVITAGKGPDASAADIAERDEMITSLQINP